jgi:hypothetical protein
MAFVSPTSLLLLMGYGRVLDRFGPKGEYWCMSLYIWDMYVCTP